MAVAEFLPEEYAGVNLPGTQEHKQASRQTRARVQSTAPESQPDGRSIRQSDSEHKEETDSNIRR